MNWINYLPEDTDVQASAVADMQACASYSAVHIAEMLLRKQTGMFWEFSERALAKLSGTTPQGNKLQNVVDALNKYGLILAKDWPELLYASSYQNVTWQQYYADIPQSVLNRAYRVEASMSSPITFDEPPWTIIKSSSGEDHIVAQINTLQYYDSYEIRVKWFQSSQPIISQRQLIIKFLNMPNAEFVHKAGTQEYGFYLPALSPEAIQDKALNLGLPITKPDGTVDFTLAKEVSGL